MYIKTSEMIEVVMGHSGTIMGTIIGAVVGFLFSTEIIGYLSVEMIQLEGSIGYFVFKALCEYYGAMLFAQMGRYLGRGLDYGMQKHFIRDLSMDKRYNGPIR